MVFRRSYFLLFSSLENGLLINIENLKPFSNVLRKLKQFLQVVAILFGTVLIRGVRFWVRPETG